jgi:hypothetical protein
MSMPADTPAAVITFPAFRHPLLGVTRTPAFRLFGACPVSAGILPVEDPGGQVDRTDAHAGLPGSGGGGPGAAQCITWSSGSSSDRLPPMTTTSGAVSSARVAAAISGQRPVPSMTGTGEPTSWAAREPTTMSWLEHAAAYAAMKWPLAAAHTRAAIADGLATITPAVSTPGRGRPPAAVLRAALYRHAFNPARAGSNPARRDRSAGRGTEPLAAAGRPGRPAGEPARAGHPDLAPRWDPRGSCHHHPTAPFGACAGGFTDPRRYALNRAYARRSAGWARMSAGRDIRKSRFSSCPPLCALLAQLVKAAGS